MFSVISLCSFEQYEKNEPGISFKAKMSESMLKQVLSFFGDYIEDPPHYHIQLRSSNGDLAYIIIDRQE